MAKEITSVVKLQIKAGAANPAPPIGPVLGQHGVNIMEFCKQFNARTQKDNGQLTPVLITIYKDRSFTFEVRIPPVSYLLMKAAKIEKGSGVPNRDKVGSVSRAEVKNIANMKMVELNCSTELAAMNTVMGTARSMGIEIRD